VADARPIAPGLFDVDAGRLIAARCVRCAKLHFPASAVCPYCAADGCDETRVGAHGRLRLFTAVANPPPGYRGALPFGFGVVEVEDGLCVVTRLTEARLERLRPGLPMRLVIEPLFSDAEGPVLSWAFAPESA
jgi:uncharacterized OB-fold protein